jgi:RimJ/RimL family protein N-acetyltransferase
MYGQLMAILPFEPALLDGFIEQTYELGARHYETCGHHHVKTVYVFVAARPADSPAANIPPQQLLPRLTPDAVDGFITLFDAIFPDTFYTGAQVVERLNTERLSEQEQVFIYTEGDAVLGFCHASVNQGANEGYIEFVGVAEQARRRGIARRLLQAAMHWLFEEQAMPKIGLTTGDDNVNAHALYQELGFQLEHTGLAYRKRGDREAEGKRAEASA